VNTVETVTLQLRNEITGPASAAKASLSQMQQEVARSADGLRELQGRMKVMQSGNVVDVGQWRALSSAIVDQRGKLAAAQESYIALGATAGDALRVARVGTDGLAAAEAKAAAQADKLAAAEAKVAAKAAAQAEKTARAGNAAASATTAAGNAAKSAIPSFDQLRTGATSLTGVIGQGAPKLALFGNALVKFGPYGAIVVTALAVVTIGVLAFVSAVSHGIEAASAMRDEFLTLQGAMEGSASAALDVEAAVSSVVGTTALARSQVVDYGTQLAQAGLRGDELTRALEAMAIAGSAGGDKVASAFLETVKGAKAAGQSVDALSADMKSKLGDVAAKQALALGVQLSKAKENITGLFSGADIEPFLRGLHAILSIFDQNSEAGRSLKAVITDMVNTAIGYMLRLALVMVKTYTAIKQNAVAWTIVKAAFYAVVVVLGALVAAVGLVVGAFALGLAIVMVPIVAVIAAVMAIVSAVKYVATAASEAWDSFTGAITNAVAALSDISLVDIGKNMIAGLARGIVSGAGEVLSAMVGTVSGAVTGAKDFLGIHSPSTLMDKEVGYQLPAGEAQGITRGAPLVADAMANVNAGAVDAASSSAPALGAGSAGATSQAGPTFLFDNCTFGSGLTIESLREMLRVAFDMERSAAGST